MKPNTSGVKGVNWHKANQKWHVRIYVNKEPIYVGFYQTLEDAKQAYEEAMKKHCVAR